MGFRVEMYSSAISGSTRLSNGNTLITFGMQGTFIEVDYSGEIVWKYVSPVNNLGIMSQGIQYSQVMVTRYSKSQGTPHLNLH